jgi:hypothetical protein
MGCAGGGVSGESEEVGKRFGRGREGEGGGGREEVERSGRGGGVRVWEGGGGSGKAEGARSRRGIGEECAGCQRGALSVGLGLGGALGGDGPAGWVADSAGHLVLVRVHDWKRGSVRVSGREGQLMSGCWTSGKWRVASGGVKEWRSESVEEWKSGGVEE